MVAWLNHRKSIVVVIIIIIIIIAVALQSGLHNRQAKTTTKRQRAG